MNIDGNPKQIKKKGTISDIPKLPGWLEMFAKLTGATFKTVQSTPHRAKEKRKAGWKICRCGCGNRFLKTTMVYMGGDNVKVRDNYWGPECAKRKMG